ncbi:Neurotrypsin, partial [Exaiptasia diaphana]
GPDPIWLDDVKCNGDEPSLDQCHHREWGTNDCFHSDDVGIVCNTRQAPLRLSNKISSPSSVQGILQIYHNGVWGTICNNIWSRANTDIACKQLGYQFAVMSKHLGQGLDPIWLDNVKCNGDEPSLDQCHHWGWGTHDCDHRQDVGIVCSTKTAAPLRLSNKTKPASSLVQGILQIYYNASWGTICDDGWSWNATNIACKQLGYNNAVKSKHLGQGPDPIWLDGVKCNGNESLLDQCHHRGWGSHNCDHRQDVGIVCNASQSPLRLLDEISSPSSMQGILQIYHNGVWGTICNNRWSRSNTRIACKQLGYQFALSFKHLGQGPDPIWLSDVECNGDEPSLVQCQHRGWGTHYCDHRDDVGIVCKRNDHMDPNCLLPNTEVANQ